MNETDMQASLKTFENACKNLPCYFVYGFGIPSFAILGIIGNFISGVVLLRFQRQSIINIQLVSLCLYDSLLLLCASFLYVPLAHCDDCRNSKINNACQFSYFNLLKLQFSILFHINTFS